MKRIMKVAVLTACIGAMNCFAGRGAKDPDAVALDLMQKLSLGQANLEYLAKNCTENTAISLAISRGDIVTELKGVTFKVRNTEINGDKAIVSIEQTHADGKRINKMDLVKVDGVWRVDINEDGGSNAKNIADACVSNMKQIQTAFEMAMMAGKTVKSVSDLCGANGYLKVEPKCPLGGKYQIDKDFNITCSSGEKGHVLSCGATNEKDGSNAKNMADACVSNMKQIQAAFEMAMMAGKTVKSVSDLCGANGYLKVEPKCPLGGKYQIDKDFNITCSSGEKGHSLSL